ncbi:aldehyde dehydrogenase family protein [Candidatus Foliamicus sp.]
MFNKLLVHNEWCDSSDGETLGSINPADEKEIARLPLATAADVDKAVESGRDAFKTWRNSSLAERAYLLNRLADLIEQNKDEIAKLETLDMGKPLRESYLNVQRSVVTARYYAGAIDKYEGNSYPVDNTTFNFSTFEPLGVTAHITPWNYPFANAMRSLPTAIAAGCTVVIKPSTNTSLTTLFLGKLCIEAGFPPGVVNVVTGSGAVAGSTLAGHPGIGGVTFTGSVSTGTKIMASAAANINPVVLELGGKNPQVVFADANLERAVAETMRGAYTNAGQVCTSVSRLLLEKPIYEEYVDILTSKLEALTIGNGMDNPDIGPLVSKQHYNQVSEYSEIARAEGADLVTGGERADGFEKGYYYRPTLFANVENSMRIAQEEVFGLILAAISFESEEEALAISNDSPFGLTSGIFTRDIDKAMRFAKGIEAGMVWVNKWFQGPVQVPHGGAKTSGLGREQGLMALRNYSYVKDIAIHFD